MFEESSSDEDEKKPVETKTTEDDDGKTAEDENNKDDDDDDKKEKSGDNSDDQEKKKLSTAGLFDDSSDDDDDDAVFDDAGAVVGSSAPAFAKKKVAGSNNDSDGDGPEKKSAAKVSSRLQHATVLKADRPDEGTSLHMTKLPNVVAIQPTAFDEVEYDEKEEEELYKGYVHNMVRWRYKRDGSGAVVREGGGGFARESNSKLVKWSDGSFTLHIGKESFDIQNVDSSTSGGFSGLNGYVYLSQKATFKNEENDDDDDAELQNGGTVLECIGPVASRLVAKPSSLQSESHKSLTVAVRQRTVKRAKIAQYMTEEDPERLKQERIKYNADADKLKQRKRTTGGSSNNYRSSGGGRRPGMNRGYLEASDDEGYDTVNIRALKKGSANNYDDEMDDYGYESDEDYDQSFANRNRKRQRKAAVEEDSDDDEEMVFDDDDDDEVKIHQKKKSSAVLDDDE